MRTQISLKTKVLLFVSVPLLIQLGLLAALAQLQKDAEDALQASVHSKAVSDKIQEITSDIFKFARRYKSREALENVSLDDDMGKMLVSQVRQDYGELKELTKNQPEILSTVIASERKTDEALETYRQIKDLWLHKAELSERDRILLARKMRSGRMEGVVQTLIVIADEQRKRFDKVPEEQAVFRKKAQAIMIALGVFDLGLGVVLALFLTKGITERLQRVSENTMHLAAGVPLHPAMQGTDEIAKLDQVFHRMADELNEASRLKQEVTAMITHDLRSPLNTVVNVLDYFESVTTKAKKLEDSKELDESKDSEHSNERSTRYALMGRRNTERMLSLINDLLDIEKIQSGNMNVDITDFEISECFTTCEELTAAAAEEVGVKLIFAIDNTDNTGSSAKGNVSVRADKNLIDRVIANLVSNAIRYSPKGKAVRISCCEEGRYAKVSVSDEGQGIPAAELSTVFERFRQLKSGGTKNKGGSGLGLTICKAIVELNAGKIWVVSSGDGSTFSFTLPLAKKLSEPA